MGIVTDIYKKNFLCRYDKDEAIPYYSAEDFPGLVCVRGAFENSENVTIQYFTYFYEKYDTSKLVVFCPGMGPGHTAYLAEIETLCRAGYRVLTLDYTGCGASGGERMTSVNAPVRDVCELLDLCAPAEDIIPVGHSLGGYTALTLANITPAIKRAVVISGFVSISDEMMGFVKLRPLANVVKRYEKKLLPRYGNIDNLAYLATTTDRIRWFHSTDDPMVNFKYNGGRVAKLALKRTDSLDVTVFGDKKHNPQYTKEALDTMNAWMGGYYKLLKENPDITLEERITYFSDKPIAKMTAQDPAVFDEIIRFIEGRGGI